MRCPCTSGRTIHFLFLKIASQDLFTLWHLIQCEDVLFSLFLFTVTYLIHKKRKPSCLQENDKVKGKPDSEEVTCFITAYCVPGHMSRLTIGKVVSPIHLNILPRCILKRNQKLLQQGKRELPLYPRTAVTP